ISGYLSTEDTTRSIIRKSDIVESFRKFLQTIRKMRSFDRRSSLAIAFIAIFCSCVVATKWDSGCHKTGR
ncbi:hypothetical protein NPIL_412271, partial [Nephila pilipes]